MHLAILEAHSNGIHQTQILHNPTVQHTHHRVRFMATTWLHDPKIKRDVEMKMSGLVDLGKVWGLV